MFRNLPSDSMILNKHEKRCESQLKELSKFSPYNTPEKYHIPYLYSRNNKLKIIPSWKMD